MVSVTLEGLWIVSDTIVDSRFFIKFHRSGSAIIFNFWTITENVSYPSKKLLIKQKTSSIYGDCSSGRIADGFWWIVDSLFFVKIHRSGPALIFSFSTITEHVSSPSKKLRIKKKTSSRRWMLLWNDYGWFLIELSIFSFSSNFTSPDLQ